MRRQLADTIARDRDGVLAAVRDGRLYRLLEVRIKVVDDCNARCVMCNHWRRQGRHRNVFTRERLMALAEELAALGTQCVGWTGGEPTLCEFLPDVIARMRDLGIASRMTSRGLRLDEDYANRLRRAGIAKVAVSLESADRPVHERMVGIEGAWDTAIAALRFLAAPNGLPRVTTLIYTVLTSVNVGPGLVGLIPLAQRLGVGRVHLSPLYTQHLTPDEAAKLEPTAEQAERFEHEYLPRMRRIGAELNVTISKDAEDEPPAPSVPARGPCQSRHPLGYFQHPDRLCCVPFILCTFDYDGEMFICNRLRDATGRYGNIADGPLTAILQSDRARTMRKRVAAGVLSETCAGCAMAVEDNTRVAELLAVT